MKIVTFFLLIFNTITYSQYFGISGGYSDSKAFFGDVFYAINENSFHLGYTSQSNDATGKEVSEQKSNYGRTVSGTGDYFTSVDLGYGYLLFEKLRLNLELSIATQKYYTNYIDGRFEGGGYHMIAKDETELAVGGFVGYNYNNFDFFIGYNTIRQMDFGLRFVFKH